MALKAASFPIPCKQNSSLSSFDASCQSSPAMLACFHSVSSRGEIVYIAYHGNNHFQDITQWPTVTTYLKDRISHRQSRLKRSRSHWVLGERILCFNRWFYSYYIVMIRTCSMPVAALRIGYAAMPHCEEPVSLRGHNPAP